MMKRMWWSACGKAGSEVIMEQKGGEISKKARLICPVTGERGATIY
jgi:hypothetical protein